MDKKKKNEMRIIKKSLQPNQIIELKKRFTQRKQITKEERFQEKVCKAIHQYMNITLYNTSYQKAKYDVVEPHYMEGTTPDELSKYVGESYVIG